MNMRILSMLACFVAFCAQAQEATITRLQYSPQTTIAVAGGITTESLGPIVYEWNVTNNAPAPFNPPLVQKRVAMDAPPMPPTFSLEIWEVTCNNPKCGKVFYSGAVRDRVSGSRSIKGGGLIVMHEMQTVCSQCQKELFWQREETLAAVRAKPLSKRMTAIAVKSPKANSQ